MTAIERTNIPWREQPHLRISEAAEIAGISGRAMERQLSESVLEVRRIGQVRFITTNSFLIWLGEGVAQPDRSSEELSADSKAVLLRLTDQGTG